METLSTKFREWAERMAERNGDPEYQRHAARLATELRDFEAFTVARERRARLLRSGVPEEHWAALDSPRECGATIAMFVNLHELATASSFDDEFWDRLESAPVLALDELGGEKMHDAFESRLYGLLNARYQRNRKTVIATNLLADQFRERYLANGLERLADRLRTAAEWVNLAGPSMRVPWREAAKAEGRP